MADESTASGQASNEDPIRNLKAEFERKLSNQDEALKSANAKLEQLVAAMGNGSASTGKPVHPPEEDLETLFITNPKKAAEIIENRTEDRINRRLDARDKQQQETNIVLNQLSAEFPEIHDPGNKFTKRATELFNGLHETQRANAQSWRAVVYQAAVETGVKPKSSRSGDDNDSFSLGSHSGGSSEGMARRQKRDSLDPLTLEFARAIGQPVDDPKYMERLKKAANRKEWNKYR